jgi:ABC-type uncharacterized transport system involved in gliding motility auxiliary subunit
MTQRSSKLAFLSGTALGFVAFVGILVLAALIAQRHPIRFDLTESKRYTLAEQSIKIVNSLKDNIQIKAFFQEGGPDKDQARDLLETYRYHSNKIQYQFIDPDRKPGLAQRYQIRSYGTLVLEGFGKSQTVIGADEENISNAILKLIQEKQKVVYFLTGHGEREIGSSDKNGYSTAKAAIEKENYRVKALSLLASPKVPEDAALVVVADPQKPLRDTEIQALRQYLQQNGSFFALLEPFTDTGLQSLLESFGITLSEDIVVDTMSRVFGASYLMPVVTQYGLHKITDGFNIACFFPTARSVVVSADSPDKVELTDLAATSEYSWSATHVRLDRSETPEFDPGQDKRGPITVAVTADISTGSAENENQSDKQQEAGSSDSLGRNGQAQLAVFGDSDFASNSYFDLQGNSDFFLNTINYLAQQENLITIERTKTRSTPLTLNRAQSQLLFWVGLVLMPAVVLCSGLVVFRLRRKYR